MGVKNFENMRDVIYEQRPQSYGHQSFNAAVVP